jgi:hypothetical protein
LGIESTVGIVTVGILPGEPFLMSVLSQMARGKRWEIRSSKDSKDSQKRWKNLGKMLKSYVTM